MNKKLKKALIIIIGLIVLAVAAHLTVSYLIPFITEMHNAPTY